MIERGFDPECWRREREHESGIEEDQSIVACDLEKDDHSKEGESSDCLNLDDRHACHRENETMQGAPWSAFITRQIWPHEPEFRSSVCQDALRKELEKLRSKGTWDVSSVCELADVKAGTHGPAVIGRAYAIMGEKHSELAEVDMREMKARIVFQGNCLKMSPDVCAADVFQDVSNTPANMAIARAAIGAGSAVGMKPTLRDVSQAYLQSDTDIAGDGDPETWVLLPRDWWDESWFHEDGFAKVQGSCLQVEEITLWSSCFWEKMGGAP